MKKLSFVLVLFGTLLFVQDIHAQAVKWYTFSEAVKLNEKAPRKIMIDVYTDWCGWCKVMDEQTFQHPDIAKILNEKYYAVKFDAERRDTVIFQETVFLNKGEGRRPTHDLAVALLNGKMSYPSIVFMNEKNQLITAVPGFQKPEQMEPLLMYIFQSLYEKNLNYQEFVDGYKKESSNGTN
ncbi:MAG: DUF255 domain-containing protein [Salinivirgaceae bacterium]|jgi:thioredoxin-related protein|nr:DUF255 domain-containing protein [Salinivirgaceae bacterium]